MAEVGDESTVNRKKYGGRLGRGVRRGAGPAHASTTRLYSSSNDTTRDDELIIIIIQHVPAAILPEMEVPSQQPADHVLAAARAAGLLRRHARLRGQDAASAQGKVRSRARPTITRVF